MGGGFLAKARLSDLGVAGIRLRAGISGSLRRDERGMQRCIRRQTQRMYANSPPCCAPCPAPPVGPAWRPRARSRSPIRSARGPPGPQRPERDGRRLHRLRLGVGRRGDTPAGVSLSGPAVLAGGPLRDGRHRDAERGVRPYSPPSEAVIAGSACTWTARMPQGRPPLRASRL
jgi:hypothetical protein